MAFVAKDGSKHTNRDGMKTADAKHEAHKPRIVEEHPDHEDGEAADTEGAHIPQEGEQHDIGNIDDLSNAFEQHLQEEAAGQPHDPENIKKLHSHFSKYMQEEKQESPEGY